MRYITIHLLVEPFGWGVHVYKRYARGRVHRQVRLASVFVPGNDLDLPQDVLRRAADQLDLPLLERWQPPA